MRYRVPYTGEAERQVVLQDNSGMFLAGEENLLEGDFLVFDDIKAVEPESEFKKLSLGGIAPGEVDVFVDANVTDLATATGLLKVYGKAILWLARKANLA